MKVTLPEPLPSGERLTLEIDFSVRVPHKRGRYGWAQQTVALNRWYPMLNLLTPEGWRDSPDYLLHMPYQSDAARYKLVLDVPRDYVVASGCDTVSEKEEGARKVVTLESSAPLREMSLALSRDYRVFVQDADGVTVKAYYLAGREAFGRMAAQSAAGALRYYAEHFGPYPYKQFSVAPVGLGYGGSQNAGMIFVDARLGALPPFLDRYLDFLVSHETGHQWFYNMVGNDEFKQLWLDEGLNSFWTLRYLEAKYGVDGKVIDVPAWVERWLPIPTFRATRIYRYTFFAIKGLDRAVVSDIASFYEPSFIFSVAYGKGSAVIDMLASLIGEEALAAAMRRYVETYRFRNATVEDFIKICEEESGRDLRWFFEEWLTTPKLCDYGIRKAGKDLVLERRGGIVMPVSTRVVFEDGSVEDFLSPGDAPAQPLPLPADKKVRSATVDPGRALLDVDRVNNHFPRRVDAKLAPVYLPLHEMGLFLKDDALSWVTGPVLSADGWGLRSSFQKPDVYRLYASSQYDLNAENWNSRAGFEKFNVFGGYQSAGAEFLHREAYGDDDEDLDAYKLSFRKELGLGYSLFEPNSHVMGYLTHNRSAGEGPLWGASGRTGGRRYRTNKETIFGLEYYFSNAGASIDPSVGYRLAAVQEVAGHVLGGGDSFERTELDVVKYLEFKGGHKMALRFKGGGGHPKDKYLFYLGSDRDLRGYDYKEIKGSAMLLGSAEYRFPLWRDIDRPFFFNVFSLEQVQGAVFFDAGSAWYESFNESGFRKDVGGGLRIFFEAAGGVERFALRLDFAFPLDGEDRDTHVWVGLNQAF
jgi:hypothetical protein